MKKLTLSLIFFVLSISIAQAGSLNNYPYLYKGIRSVGMGGTFTAVGKDPESLFYNPAGLYDMGFQIAIINPLIEIDESVLDLTGDIQDALDKDTDTERIDALTDIISTNMGKPLHGRMSLFPHLAIKNAAIGVIGQGLVDMRLHNPLSSQGAVEVQGGYEYGPVMGFSIGFPTTGLRIGVGAKYIFNSWVAEGFTIRQIASEEFDPLDSKKDNADYSFDVGLLYDIPLIQSLNPRIGLSVLDITDLDFQEDSEGRLIPMRGNIGLSINPSLIGFMETILALDYQDITHQFEQDDSIGKRLHIGAEFGFLARHILLRAGLNQGYTSAGAELDLWALKIGYAYYSEELGAYAGQDKDTRHLAQLSIGW